MSTERLLNAAAYDQCTVCFIERGRRNASEKSRGNLLKRHAELTSGPGKWETRLPSFAGAINRRSTTRAFDLRVARTAMRKDGER